MSAPASSRALSGDDSNVPLPGGYFYGDQAKSKTPIIPVELSRQVMSNFLNNELGVLLDMDLQTIRGF